MSAIGFTQYTPYTSPNFQDQMILEAVHMTNIEDAIVNFEEEDRTVYNTVSAIKDAVDLPVYSASSTYIVGDMVTYGGNVYECTAKITTPEEWNQTHWEQKVSAGSIESRIKRKIELIDGLWIPVTVRLLAAGWQALAQTVQNVDGVTETNTIIVSPHPSHRAVYASAGITCTAQGTNTLTFTTVSVPSSDVDVNVLIMK